MDLFRQSVPKPRGYEASSASQVTPRSPTVETEVASLLSRGSFRLSCPHLGWLSRSSCTAIDKVQRRTTLCQARMPVETIIRRDQHIFVIAFPR